jgi:hypothetical protein
MSKQTEINELEHSIKFFKKELAIAEKSKGYILRHLGKVYTLYGAERAIRFMEHELTMLKHVKRYK